MWVFKVYRLNFLALNYVADYHLYVMVLFDVVLSHLLLIIFEKWWSVNNLCLFIHPYLLLARRSHVLCTCANGDGVGLLLHFLVSSITLPKNVHRDDTALASEVIQTPKLV